MKKPRRRLPTAPAPAFALPCLGEVGPDGVIRWAKPRWRVVDDTPEAVAVPAPSVGRVARRKAVANHVA